MKTWRCVQKDKHMAEAIDFLKILVPASSARSDRHIDMAR